MLLMDIPQLEAFIAEHFPQAEGHVIDDEGLPRASGEAVAEGLYFCGFRVAPTGMLREIGIEAERIASAIASQTRSTPKSDP